MSTVSGALIHPHHSLALRNLSGCIVRKRCSEGRNIGCPYGAVCQSTTFLSPVETPARSVRQRPGERLAFLAPAARQRPGGRLDSLAPTLGCSHSKEVTKSRAPA